MAQANGPQALRLGDPTPPSASPFPLLAWDLPGFGSPRPEGFTCTKEEYVSWLIERLEGIGEPVDLVGHDWGCLLTARVASVRLDLIRTRAGPVSAEYDWHPLAKLWQDHVAGDRWAKEYDAAAFAKDLTDNLQIPAELAEQTAGHVDETMRDSILKLCRSALTVGAEWEPDLANLAGPSLVFWGGARPGLPHRVRREDGRFRSRHPFPEARQQPLDADPETGRGRRGPRGAVDQLTGVTGAPRQARPWAVPPAAWRQCRQRHTGGPPHRRAYRRARRALRLRGR
ncbi:alpha/beta fold hydrolase [Streptomyces sp. NPDC016566]|uniref:alpha/beta fold hydrolase n=1 Tax=Streptomyces sp. NPDC016566 TaxID=3364967 RepID=UPI0037016CC3